MHAHGGMSVNVFGKGRQLSLVEGTDIFLRDGVEHILHGHDTVSTLHFNCSAATFKYRERDGQDGARRRSCLHIDGLERFRRETVWLSYIKGDRATIGE